MSTNRLTHVHPGRHLPHGVRSSATPRSLLFLAWLVFTACATSADVLQVDPSPRPVADWKTVQFFLDRPSRPFRVIAWVAVANKWAWGASSKRYVNRFKKEAAKLGGDAVVVTNSRTELVGATITPNPYTTSVDAKRKTTWQAAVIVWTY